MSIPISRDAASRSWPVIHCDKTSPSFLKAGFCAAILVGAVSLSLPAQSPAPSPSPSPALPPSGPPRHAPPFRRPPNLLMEALDTNHDGILSAEEIANAPASLKKLDKNGDGQLTEDELRPPPPGGPGGPPRATRTRQSRREPPRVPGIHPMRVSRGRRDRRPWENVSCRQPKRRHGRPTRPGSSIPRRASKTIRSQRRLAMEARDGNGPASQPATAPLTLFDLLDANHDGMLSDEELRHAPVVLRSLDLKNIGPLDRGVAAALPPPPVR